MNVGLKQTIATQTQLAKTTQDRSTAHVIQDFLEMACPAQVCFKI